MCADSRYRSEHDSLGEVKVPADALYGAQTQRALENFPVSGITLPPEFIHALGRIKACAARANGQLGQLEPTYAEAIASAALEVASGEHDTAFPVDVFQTGSGTSSNMNANEVIATLATARLGLPVHPNDHVNLGQSSNDVIPTAIHLSTRLQLRDALCPALEGLTSQLRRRADELKGIVKTGRTHLQDALPLTFDQELEGWAAQVEADRMRLEGVMPRLEQLAIGGTAIGTGVNAHPDFAETFSAELNRSSGIDFHPAENRIAAIASQDTAVELSGQLRVVATTLGKIANDLRWMGSGPLSGLGEITLPPLQPGSSIMPGKVNPVISESVLMVCAQVNGNDAAIAIAGQAGNFQLNTMLPLIAHNLLQNIALLSSAAQLLGEKAIAGFSVNRDRLEEHLSHNPILATALNSIVGYERAAEIAKAAYRQGRPIKEVALEMTELDAEQLDRLLDPLLLTHAPHCR